MAEEVEVSPLVRRFVFVVSRETLLARLQTAINTFSPVKRVEFVSEMRAELRVAHQFREDREVARKIAADTLGES